MTRVFVSHAKPDKDTFVRKLVADLEANGVNVWVDEQEIRVGENFIDEINQGLRDTDATLLVVSSAFLESEWARLETNSVLDRMVSENSGRILPVLIEDVWANVQPLLRSLLYADFRRHRHLLAYREALGKLLRGLQGDAAPRLEPSPLLVLSVTGGRDPVKNSVAIAAAEHFGRLVGAHEWPCIVGPSHGVDEAFARGFSEAVSGRGGRPDDLLKSFSAKGRKPDHSLGRAFPSKYSSRSEGVAELVAEASVLITFGGWLNTNYLGVQALLEDRLVLPVASTQGASEHLHSLIQSRYARLIGPLLPQDRFMRLAELTSDPEVIAKTCYETVQAVRGS